MGHEEQFLHALNFCHLLPGPEAQQLATWIERLENASALKGGLGAITAAVVGVIANLTLWGLFSLTNETRLISMR